MSLYMKIKGIRWLLKIVEVGMLIVIVLFIAIFVKGQFPSHMNTPKQIAEGELEMGANKSAPLLAIYWDFSCIHCRDFYKESYDVLKKEYIDTNKIRIVFKDLPRTMEQDALSLHQIPYCAREQGKYEESLQKMFAWKNDTPPPLAETLKEVESIVKDPLALDQCVEERRYDYLLRTARNEADALSIDATPAFVLNGHVLHGNQGMEAIKRFIDKEL